MKKKIFLSIAFSLIWICSFATTRFLVAGGTGNWNSTTNWSLTDGGISGAPFPTATEDVVINANSGNANIAINVSSACLSITCSSYTGTLSGSSAFAVGGSITWASGMTITASGPLNFAGNGTITSNGKAWGGGLTETTAGITMTLADDFTIAGTFTHTAGGTTLTMNGAGKNFCVKGNISMTAGRVLAGTANIKFNGSANQSVSVSGSINCAQLEIASTGGTVTMASAVNLGGANFLYTSGTMDFTTNSNALNISASCTITTNGQSIANLAVSANITITLGSALVGSGTLTMQTSMTWAGSYGWTFATQTATLTAKTYTLQAGQTYTITGTMTNTSSTSAAHNSFVSSSPGTTYNIALSQGATQDNSFVNFTDGIATQQTIWTYKGTVTTSTNINVLPSQPPTISYSISN